MSFGGVIQAKVAITVSSSIPYFFN